MSLEVYMLVIFLYSAVASSWIRSQPKTTKNKQKALFIFALPLGSLFTTLLILTGGLVI